MKYPELSSNPLSLLVSPKTIKVDASKIVSRDVEKDDIFFKKYCDYLQGKLKGYITRISISRIKPGFYRRVNSGWEYVVDESLRESIDYMMMLIRGGYRPALHLYHNPNKGCDYDFVCADDLVTFNAYLDLGVSKPPVIILGSKKGLEESAFTIKGFKNGSKSHTHLIYSVEVKNRDSFLTLLGKDTSEDIASDLLKLDGYLELLKSEFREFHFKAKSDVSYHQIIFSMIVRAQEMVKAIRILINEGFHIQAGNIVRSLYELSLTFYLCWLSPHEITRFVQISSVMTENEWKKHVEKDLKELIESKLDRSSIEALRKAMNYQYSFVQSVIEKARLSPFGEAYYRDVYSFLSDIAHHDFSMSARYKHSLEFGDDAIYDKDVKDSIIRIVDFCITKIFIRVADDIGSNISFDMDKLNKQLQGDRFFASSKPKSGA
jgi:hypothetical protein